MSCEIDENVLANKVLCTSTPEVSEVLTLPHIHTTLNGWEPQSSNWKAEKNDPRDHQREMTATINSAIEELNELQEEIRKLKYEEVGETR